MKINSLKDLQTLKNQIPDAEILSDGQTKIITRYFGVINPENICDYFGIGGYEAALKAASLSQQEIIDEIKTSGLRGRGGAGFSTGKKWQFAKDNQSDEKYVICNCDEGDPGAFMDRSMMEQNPHAVVEGMIIAGMAIGAKAGIVYVRAEYPLAGKRIEKAIDDAKAYGLLGQKLLGTDFDFDITVIYGAGAFVCGEETALIESCHGKRGEPNNKPPYPAEAGYKNKPTIINNVETLSNIPLIMLNGSDWFKGFGSENTPGTKVFALSGDVKNAGLVELEMGETIEKLVEVIGGGTRDGKPFKAVQLGGPSGGALPYSMKNLGLDFDSLSKHNAMMGSGGVIVIGQDTCMLQMVKYFLDFTKDESCGKCTPCRLGSREMYNIISRITEGTACKADVEKLEKLCYYIRDNSLCGLGKTCPNPVIATFAHFKEELLNHVVHRKCQAKVCKNLIKFEIDKNKCIGCSLCSRGCPNVAISGTPGIPPFVIDQEKCIKCGKCESVCPVKAVMRTDQNGG